MANTGDTIPADDLEHVFERFYRVEKSRDRALGGAGIGLAIVKQLVESTGGRVGVDSRDGQTRFWFSVPAEPARPSWQADRDHPDQDPTQSDPLGRPQALSEERDGDDDRHRRAKG